MQAAFWLMGPLGSAFEAYRPRAGGLTLKGQRRGCRCVQLGASGGQASVWDEQLLLAWAQRGARDTASQLILKLSHLSPQGDQRSPALPVRCPTPVGPPGSVAKSMDCSLLVEKQCVFGGKILWLGLELCCRMKALELCPGTPETWLNSEPSETL